MPRIQLRCPTCGDVVLSTRSLAVSDGTYHFTCPICAQDVSSQQEQGPLADSAQFSDADITAFVEMLQRADWFDHMLATGG